MPRKAPRAAQMVGGKGNRQRVWEAILAQGDAAWNRQQIAKAAEVTILVTKAYVECLLAAGIVAPAGEVPGAGQPQQLYTLVKHVGLEAPRLNRDGQPTTKGIGQERMWRCLRMLPGDINARELAAHASTDDLSVTAGSAGVYLSLLNCAGYLRVIKTRGATRYALLPGRNTGPRPPMICKTSVVYDPNEDKVVWQRRVTPEDAL